MQIWSAEIKELELLFTSIKGRFPELGKDLEHLIKTDDENVALLYSRRCLEIIVTDLCECELKRPRKTEPLKGIIDKLHREEKVPSHIITSMDHLNSLSTYGTHPKEFDPEQVRPILLNLATIIKWYVKYKDIQSISQVKPEEKKYDSKEPVDTREGISKPKKKWMLLLSGLLLIVAIIVVALFVFNIVGGKQTKALDKSIAVLPFKSLSDDPEKQYLADGMMDAILLHLSKIEDLRVMSRTSVEQYRKTDKTTSVIGHELGVAYLLEGSFQKYGDDARLIVQLIKTGKEGHEWANQYDRKWNDILSVQSEVAQAIASELDAIITPEEKQLIEKIPTQNMTAYDLYLKANEYQKEYSRTRNLSSYQTAVTLYRFSLEIDSTFAKAYAGLARAYYDRYYWPEFFTENFLDSCLVLVNIALSIDNKLDEAYYIKGQYYEQNGNIEEALNNYDKTININPNFYSAYTSKGYLYSNILSDMVKSLENFYKALSLASGDERPTLLGAIGSRYSELGFFEKAKYYYQEAYALDSSQIQYLSRLAWMEFNLENYEEALKLYKKVYEIDTTVLFNLHFYLYAPGHDEEAFAHARKLIELNKRTGVPIYFQSHRIGYIYYKMSQYEEAEDYFKQQIKYSEESIRLNRFYSMMKHAHYDIAATYTFLGDKEKAYQHLDEFNTMDFFGLMLISFVKNDPMFISIHNEERFQNIVRDMETKNQAEHERVRKWMEEQGTYLR